MSRPVCITGMHRSGTSMVARAAQAAGVWLGEPDDLVPAAPDNPDGFFEHERLVAASDALFEGLGGGWDCPPSLPDGWGIDGRCAAAASLAAEVIAELSAHDAWGWKDPRAAVVLPFWLGQAADLGVVLCVRNPLEVAASLRARNGCSLALGLRLWYQYMRAAIEATQPADRLVTHYDAWFHQPAVEVDRLVAFSGLHASAVTLASAASVPARHQRHSRFDARALRAARVDGAVRDLYERLCAEAEWTDGASAPGPAEIAVTNGHPAAANGNPAVGRVSSAAVEIGVAQYEVYKRNGRVSQLEKRVAELETELAAARATSEPPSGSSLDHLQSSVYDLHLTVSELTARVTNGIDRETADRDIAYAQMIHAVRTQVHRSLPTDADILVISERDPALLDLHGRTARHFPVGPSVDAPGPVPDDDAQAVAHLVARQALGASHLVVPPTAGWWMSAYPELARRLTTASDLVAELAEGASIHRLRAPVEVNRYPSVAAALHAAERRIDREPSVFDWTVAGLGQPSVMRPPPDEATLPYLDASIDVVAVDAAFESRHAEARRVARVGVLVGAPGEWSWRWTGAPAEVSADVIVVAPASAIGTSPRGYVDVLHASLPLGFAGQLTIIATPSAAPAWREALADRGRVVPDEDPVGAVARVATSLAGELIAVVDGTAIPLGRASRTGLVAAVRLAHAGAGSEVERSLADGRLVAVAGVADAGPLTRPIELAVPGALVAGRDLLQTDTDGFGGGYRTLGYAIAGLCRGLAASGMDAVLQPEAQVVDLGVGAPSPATLAEDHARLVRSDLAAVR
jgi:hypothetical protein